jgi:hypothetical protein
MADVIKKLLIINEFDFLIKDIIGYISELYLAQHVFLHYGRAIDYEKFDETVLEDIKQNEMPTILAILEHFDTFVSLISVVYDGKEYVSRNTSSTITTADRQEYDLNIGCYCPDGGYVDGMCKASPTIFPKSINDVKYRVKFRGSLIINGKEYSDGAGLNDVILIGYKNIIIENKAEERHIPHSLTNHCAVELDYLNKVYKRVLCSTNKNYDSPIGYITLGELLVAHLNLKKCKFHTFAEKLTKAGYETVLVDGEEWLKINTHYEIIRD